MMENSLDTIQLLNDTSELEHHPVQGATRHQKFHSHILMQGEALVFV